MNALKIIFSYLLISAISPNSNSQEINFNCDQEIKEYTDEAIQVILAGYTIRDNSKCLADQNKFKYFSIKIGDTYEGRNKKLTKISNEPTIKIISQKEDEIGYMHVQFELTSKNKKIVDSFSFFKTGNGDMKTMGCFMFDSLPKNDFIFEKCYK